MREDAEYLTVKREENRMVGGKGERDKKANKKSKSGKEIKVYHVLFLVGLVDVTKGREERKGRRGTKLKCCVVLPSCINFLLSYESCWIVLF